MIYYFFGTLIIVNIIITGVFLYKSKKTKAFYMGIITVALIFVSFTSFWWSLNMIEKIDRTTWHTTPVEITELVYKKDKVIGYKDVDNKLHKFKYHTISKNIEVLKTTKEELIANNVAEAANFEDLSGKIMIVQEVHVIAGDIQRLFLFQTEYPVEIFVLDCQN